MSEAEELKSKMKIIADRWVGLPVEKDDTVLHGRRVLDRIQYRSLKRKLEKLEKYNGSHNNDDLYEYALELFGS